MPTIYEVPLAFAREGLDEILLDYLSLPHYDRDLTKWDTIVNRVKNPQDEVNVAFVGKYVQLGDTYKSLNEALHHGGIANNVRVKISFMDSEELESDGYPETLARVDAILVGPGFGRRGIEGKLKAIRYAREMKVPFFGICLGMQCAVIEYARNVCGLKDANSTEFDTTAPHKVIYMLRDLLGVEALGGTMRLGKYPCDLREGSLARRAYGEAQISERHRHRYEVNQRIPPELRDAGLRSPGCRRTRSSSRWSSCRTTRGSSAASSTRSTRAAGPAPPALQGLHPRRARPPARDAGGRREEGGRAGDARPRAGESPRPERPVGLKRRRTRP